MCTMATSAWGEDENCDSASLLTEVQNIEYSSATNLYYFIR